MMLWLLFFVCAWCDPVEARKNDMQKKSQEMGKVKIQQTKENFLKFPENFLDWKSFDEVFFWLLLLLTRSNRRTRHETIFDLCSSSWFSNFWLENENCWTLWDIREVSGLVLFWWNCSPHNKVHLDKETRILEEFSSLKILHNENLLQHGTTRRDKTLLFVSTQLN